MTALILNMRLPPFSLIYKRFGSLCYMKCEPLSSKIVCFHKRDAFALFFFPSPFFLPFSHQHVNKFISHGFYELIFNYFLSLFTAFSTFSHFYLVYICSQQFFVRGH